MKNNFENRKIEVKSTPYLCPEKIREYVEEENYFINTVSDLHKLDCIGDKRRVATVKEVYHMAELVLKYSFDRQPKTKADKELMIECISECILNNCIVFENDIRIVEEEL